MLPDQSLIPFGVVKLIANNRVIGQSATESGEDTGRFRFSYVPAGTIKIEAFDPATGRSGVAIGQLTTEGQVVTLDVHTQGLGIVSGVITSNGVPQDGANVSVSSGSFRASANADGNGVYTVPGVPEGTITVRADIGGALSSTATGTLLGDGTTLTLDVALQASGAVVGVVTAADGATPAPPSIVTMPIGSGRFTTTTNDLGEYRFDLVPAGARSVSVDVIGSIDTAVGSVVVGGGQTATLPLQLIGVGTIAGTALTAGGLPIGGTVTLTGSGVVPWSTTLTVNPDGSFIAAQVLAGPFSAQVRNTVGSITLYGTATGVVSPGATTPIVVTLQSTGEVRGSVMRADGTTPATGANVTLLSGSSVKGTAQVFSTGEFSFTGLPLGAYAVSVYDAVTNGHARALNLNLAANGDTAQAGVLTLDNTLPVAQSIAPADGDTGVSRTQPIVITFSDALANTSGVDIKKGAATLGNSRTLSADGRTLTLTSTWPDSSEITIEVTTGVTDIFDRHPAAQVISKFVTVDTTAPTVTSVSPLNDAYQVAGTVPIVITFSETIANADLAGLIAVTRAGSPIPGTSVQGPSHVVTFTPSTALADNGIHNVSVAAAVDGSGNEQGAAFTSFFATTDTVAPVLTITAPSQTLWVTNNKPVIAVSRSDATSGLNTSSGAMSLDNIPVATVSGGNSFSHTVQAGSPLADGTHAISATSADRAGNVGSVSGSFMLDATAPSTPVITNITQGQVVAGQATVTATATDATSGVARIDVRRDGSTILNLLPPTFSGVWNTNATAEGSHQLTALAVDVAGNSGALSAPLDVVVDNDPITLTITAPVANFRTRKPVTTTATVSEPVWRVEFTLGATTVSDTTSPYSAVLPVDGVPEGNATITVKAYGLIGEVVTQTRLIIIDRTSPVARWALDEGAGTSTTDASGNGHTGTLIDGTAWSLGQFGKAIALDGAKGGVTVPDHEDFDVISAVSLSAWALPATSGSVQTLIEKSGFISAYSLGITPDGRAEAVVYPNGTAVVVQSVNALTPQLWSHLAATYDGTALKLFVNGSLITTTSASGPLPVTDGAIWLGRSEAGNVLNGRLDEVRIYDRALSASEVSGLAAATTSKTLLAGGFRASWVAQPGGTAWAMGQNNQGSLGVAAASGTTVPTPMAAIGDLANIAADNTHGLALTRAGVLYAWGNTAIGDGTTSIRTTPVAIALDTVVQVAAGTSHSGAVLANGDAYTWGSNGNGQMGDGTTTTSLVPKLVMTGVRAIAMSGNTTMFLKTNGTVWGAGVNSSGQLGNNATASTVSTPVQMLGITTAVTIALGDSHSTVLLADGTLRGAGINGRTGDGTNTQRTTPVVVVGLNGVVQIAGNGGNTLARKADGTAWGWGANNAGELGDGTTTARWTPQQVPGLADITDIGAGNDLSLAVTAAGVVYTWGDNGFGELGDGTIRNRRSPAAISFANYVWKTPTPQISVLSNTFSNNVVVTISNALTTDVSMYYTLDGAVPTAADTPVVQNGTVTIDRSETLSVKAFHATKPESNVASETYTMAVASVSINPNSTSGVLAPTSYTLTTSTAGATIYYTLDGSDPTTASPVYTGSFLLATQTVVKVKAFRAGFTPSAIFSRTVTFNYGQLALPVISPGAGTYPGSVTVTLSSPNPSATINYTTNNSGVGSVPNATTFAYTGPFVLSRSALPLRAVAFHPDYSPSGESSVSLTVQANPPQFNPAAGNYAAGTKVLITGDQFSTAVRYTIDGSDPTSTSPLVPVGGVTVGNFTIKARTFQTGATDSTVASSTYSVTGQLTAAAVSAGDNHTLVKTPDGRLFAFGGTFGNFRGQLGDGTTTDRPLPFLLNDLTGVTAIAAGSAFSVAVTDAGRVWVWGFNINRQLGDGTQTQRTRPVLLDAPTETIATYSGLNHSVALRANGEAWTWGNNGFGQLGDGTTVTSTPHLVMSAVMAAGARADHTLFVKTDGTVWGAGLNTSGQLGDGTGTNRTTPVEMSGVADAIAVAAGANFSIVLRSDGTLRAAGQGGRLGDGTTTTRSTAVPVSGMTNVVAVGACDYHTLALKSDGTVWSWGVNTNGQVGNTAAASTQLTPIQVTGLTNITAIAAGALYSIAIDGDGVVFGWGRGGSIGDGSNKDRPTPVAISGPNYDWKVGTPTMNPASQSTSNAYAVTLTTVTSGAKIHYTRDGAEPTEADPFVNPGGTVTIDFTQLLTAKAFKSGMPPSNLETGQFSLFVAQPTFSPGTGTFTSPQSVTITTGTAGATLRYTLDGTVPTAASPIYTGPIAVSTFTNVQAMGFKSGYAQSALASRTYSFNYGTLAAPVASPAPATYLGSVTVTLSSPTMPAGSAIRYTTDGGTVGAGSPAYTAPFVVGQTSTVKARVFHSDYATSSEFSGLYTVETAAPTFSLASGSYVAGTTVTINGDPTTTIRYSFDGTNPTTSHPTVVAGTTIYVGDYTLKATATKGTSTSTVTSATYTLSSALGAGQVSGGRNHSAFVTPDGRVFTWGRALDGRLGNGTTSGDVTTPKVIHGLTGITAMSGTFWHNLALTLDGRVFSWGYNANGQLGDGSFTTRSRPVPVPSLTNIVAVASGVYHSLVLTADNQVLAFGNNSIFASLGVGSGVVESTVPIAVPGLPAIRAISSGYYHSLALAADGRVFAWGSNQYGQVGDGTTNATAPTPIEVPGLSNIVAVSAGAYFSTATHRDGRVFVWGRNAANEWSLGIGGSTDVRVPVENAALAASTVIAGYYGGFAQAWNGTLLGWGLNTFGQIGNGNTAAQPTPVAVLAPSGIGSSFFQDHSAILTAVGQLFTFGNAQYGNLGDGTTSSRPTPQAVFSLTALWAPPPPIFGVAPGSYSNVVTLVISSPMAGATIRYTLDGSTPDDSSLEVPATGEVLINSTTTIRARVFAPGRKPSAVTSGTYVIQL